jgi:hypothetical protein
MAFGVCEDIGGVIVELVIPDAAVFGVVAGPALDWACARPAKPRPAASATAAVSVRFIVDLRDCPKRDGPAWVSRGELVPLPTE